jgi:hypothetical protein
VQCSSRVSAVRREPNSHSAASRERAQISMSLQARRTPQAKHRLGTPARQIHRVHTVEQQQVRRGDSGRASNTNDLASLSRRASVLRRSLWNSVSLSGRRGPQWRVCRQSLAAAGKRSVPQSAARSAEREATGACHERQRGFVAGSTLWQKAHRGLTTRSTGPATASTVSLVRGTWCIISYQATVLASAGPVSSNVRQHSQDVPAPLLHLPPERGR